MAKRPTRCSTSLKIRPIRSAPKSSCNTAAANRRRTKGSPTRSSSRGPTAAMRIFSSRFKAKRVESLDWPEGGGALREILATGLKDMFESDLGLELKMPRTTLFKTEDDSFRQGNKSKGTQRTGALQTAVQFKHGDPPDANDFFERRGWGRRQGQGFEVNQSRRRRKRRHVRFHHAEHRSPLGKHAGAKSRRSAGPNRLVPIDAGQMLPTKDTFRAARRRCVPKRQYDPNNPAFSHNDNMLMQLPGAAKVRPKSPRRDRQNRSRENGRADEGQICRCHASSARDGRQGR